jgi:hypothetical protein
MAFSSELGHLVSNKQLVYLKKKTLLKKLNFFKKADTKLTLFSRIVTKKKLYNLKVMLR